MRDAKLGQEILTLQQAFELSSNVGISKAVYQAFSKEPERFINFLHRLRLDKPLDLSIAGEGMPMIKSPSDPHWSGITLPWMSIGYELRLTPLQTLALYNAVANNGIMVKPQFVTEIREVGQPVRHYETEVLNPSICSENTLKMVRKMLEGVVENGTAKGIQNEQYSIAGKTGTALVANEHFSYGKKIYHSSFAGYFPANKPRYSIIVTVTNPKEGVYYGSALAAPVFKEISDRIYALTSSTPPSIPFFEAGNREVLPFPVVMYNPFLATLLENQSVLSKGPKTDWVGVKPAENKVTRLAYDAGNNKVPDVRGMVLSDAVYLLENAGLSVKFIGSGRINKQSLEPGMLISGKPTIYLTLG